MTNNTTASTPCHHRNTGSKTRAGWSSLVGLLCAVLLVSTSCSSSRGPAVTEVVSPAEAAAPTPEEIASRQAADPSAVRLDGSFVWLSETDEEDTTGELEAIFTPTGDDQWEVSFHFDWEGAPRIFAGTAEGKLSSGDLSGEVQPDRSRSNRTFTFSGAFDGSTYLGEHGVFREGEYKRLGTLSLASN